MFGVVVGKEIFGGTGRNFLNPALTARAFLYFAYPKQISGNAVWTAVDGYTGATALGAIAQAPAGESIGTIVSGMEKVAAGTTWWDCFIGNMHGSMGETCTIACLIGAAILDLLANWLVADHGRCHDWHDRVFQFAMDFAGWRGTRLQHSTVVASGHGWICIWHGLHGDRPGFRIDDADRQVDLRWTDRIHDGPGPVDQSCVSRRNHVGDFVWQRLRPVDRLFRSSGKHQTKDGSICNAVNAIASQIRFGLPRPFAWFVRFLWRAAAVGLRSLQKRNVEVDRKKNILAAVGFKPEEINTSDKVVSLFETKIEPVLIELATGQPLTEEEAKNVLDLIRLPMPSRITTRSRRPKTKQEETAVEFSDRSKDIAGSELG